ncbi:MAG: TonB-dependent receptor plug domain-containing protein, partial [Leptospiraceae bacterium]|nr:TonB-dependent receptor plug domain-containing protein [Leptospiraceae bacterium]
MRSVRQIILTGIFFIPTVLLAEVRATGRILDRATGRPVFDASVAVQETGAALTTGPDGEFELVVPGPGYYTLRIYVADDLYQVSKEVRFNGEIITITVGQTDVTSGTSDSDSGVRVVGLRDQTRLSRFTLSNEEIKRLPGVYGDSLKAVTTLPGISPAPPVGALPTTNILTTSFLSGFSVGPPYSNSTSGVLVLRGSGARANQFYLDGFKIQYPFHLGDQSSVINNDYIQLVDVYTGTYP